jgi:hypothetical protein
MFSFSCPTDFNQMVYDFGLNQYVCLCCGLRQSMTLNIVHRPDQPVNQASLPATESFGDQAAMLNSGDNDRNDYVELQPVDNNSTTSSQIRFDWAADSQSMPLQVAAVDSTPVPNYVADGDDLPLDHLMEIESINDSNYHSNNDENDNNNDLELEELLAAPVASEPGHWFERSDRTNDCGICFSQQRVGSIILISGCCNTANDYPSCYRCCRLIEASQEGYSCGYCRKVMSLPALPEGI